MLVDIEPLEHCTADCGHAEHDHIGPRPAAATVNGAPRCWPHIHAGVRARTLGSVQAATATPAS